VTEGHPLPPAMAERAREFTGPPAEARPAATVVLLRSADKNLQAYVLRRAKGMAFGGVYAFPGGRVDPDDRPETVRTDWADVLGVPDAEARAVVGAAVRELFEEAGVLLAGDASGEVITGLHNKEWEADRVAVLRRELPMADLLERRGLRMRDDLLHPWGRWVTPDFEPRRFDTWFFVAALPAGQTAEDVSGESDGVAWIRPGDTDGLTMLPPTRLTLRSLTAYRSIEEVFAEKRNAAVPVQPRVELTGDGGAMLRVDDL
jgi:8-oxo-dGTP pyrophosphatase MutT (NUDIX family)